MNPIYKIFLFYLFPFSILFSEEINIASYNCGCLPSHYDYLRSACMQQLIQQRYETEPEQMALNERIQQVALQRLFGHDQQARASAEREWQEEGYELQLHRLLQAKGDERTPDRSWQQKIDAMITPYTVRPPLIFDPRIHEQLQLHLDRLAPDQKEGGYGQICQVRRLLAKKSFHHLLRHDLICLQESDLLDKSLFPSHYAVEFAETAASKNGVAWNKERFQLIESIGNILDKAYAVKLVDIHSGKQLLVASAHLKGCNPFQVELEPATGRSDSWQGDRELTKLLALFEAEEVDLVLIGMDSNVTATHPRLELLRQAGYQIDAKNYLEMSCTNPISVLNTRIDWIAVKNKSSEQVEIVNLPVFNVGLNAIENNMSDHKPVAAKVRIEAP